MTDHPGPPPATEGDEAPVRPVLGPPIPPPRPAAPDPGPPPEWFFPPDDEPADALPRRPVLRRAVIALYVFIVLCVVIALLATLVPWGDLDLPFDPPFRNREYL